jgi:hypothetical protein
MDVGAQVEFKEPREAWHGREKTRTDAVHPKRHNTEVSAFVVSIYEEAGREGCLDGGGVPSPMKKKEVVPALEHHRRGGGASAQGLAL